jgi:hypothetical protein
MSDSSNVGTTGMGVSNMTFLNCRQWNKLTVSVVLAEQNLSEAEPRLNGNLSLSKKKGAVSRISSENQCNIKHQVDVVLIENGKKNTVNFYKSGTMGDRMVPLLQIFSCFKCFL